MTRETKVGLIVAGSFLCLVCIVVASKWRRGDDTAKDFTEEQTVNSVAAAKPLQNTNAPDPKKKEIAPKSEAPRAVLPPLALQVKAPEIKKPEPSAPAPLYINKPPQSPQDPSVAVSQLEAVTVVQAKDEKSKEPDKLFLPQPSVQIPDPSKETAKPNPNPDLPSFPALNKDAAPTFPSLNKDGAPTLPLKEAAPTFPPVSKDATPALPLNKDAAPPFPAVSKEAAPTFLLNKDAVPSIPAVKDKDAPTTFPPIGTPTPLPVVPTFNSLDQVKPVPANPNEAPALPPVISSPNPIPRIGATDLPSTPPIMMIPDKGGPFVSPTMTGAKSPLVPKDVNTDFYQCRPGETNFAILSLRLYGTEKYADALLAYNRDHSKMIANGAAFNVNAPALAPGQQVIHPPLGILERDYRPFVRAASASVPTIPSATSSPVKITASTTPDTARISSPASIGKGASYLVQNPNGESFLDVAERVMGDRSQWHKIWRVNQTYQPQFRIPAGTKLELPAS